MKKVFAICVVLATVIIMSVNSFASSGASHYYNKHRETASVTAPFDSYKIYVGTEVWNSNSNLKYEGKSITTTLKQKTLKVSVYDAKANKGYYTYMTKNKLGKIMLSLSDYGWDI